MTLMKLQCQWTEKMKFTASIDSHRVEMDSKSPLGDDSAMTPKQLLLAGICGCTGMDVVALMKKYRQRVAAFRVEAEASLTEGKHPIVFKEVKLVFHFDGNELDPAKAIEAVTLSQTKFCGVTAMVAKAVPITYTILLNGKKIGDGRAQF